MSEPISDAELAERRGQEVKRAMAECERLERQNASLVERAEQADYWQQRAKRAEVKATQLEFELAKFELAGAQP